MKEMLPTIAHVAVVVVLTVLFLIAYLKQRQLYEILFVIWAPTTLLRYLSNNSIYLIVLAVVQVLMFLAVIIALFRGHANTEKKPPENAGASPEPAPEPAAEVLPEEEQLQPEE